MAFEVIGRLRGVIVETIPGLVLEVGGVGYEVSVPESVRLELPPLGSEAILLIRQIFREDGVSLYGFLTPLQRRIFDLLLGVKGCGPKVALSLLGVLGEEGVTSAITADDARSLIRAPGVGARLAERILLEVKDAILQEVLLTKTARGEIRRPSVKEDDLVEALLALGYRRMEAEGAAATAREGASELEEQLMLALQVLKR